MKYSPMLEDDLLAFVRLLAEKSGKVITDLFGNPELRVDWKSDDSPVTQADRKAEEIMRNLIAKEFPDHGVLGEEFGIVNENAPYIWVLDPIDGTRAYAAGCPLFGTLISLLHKGQPLLGAIHNPVTRQLVLGNGEETTLNGRTIRMRDTSRLQDSTLLVSHLETPGKHQGSKNWTRLTRSVQDLYTWGDCYGYLLLAQGGADIMADPIMNNWDLLPLIPIIRGAGGRITDWQGKDPLIGSSIIAANPNLHIEVISILNS